MKNNPLTDLLSDPTRGEHRASGVLSALFRQALIWGRNNHPVDHDGWSRRARVFFAKPHNVDLKSDLGNLNKDLVRPEFTWPTFKKAVDFLNPHKAFFTVILVWPPDENDNSRESRYTMPFVFDPNHKWEDTELSERKTSKSPFSGKHKMLNDVAYLWRMIVRGENIDAAKWRELNQRYVASPLSGTDLTDTKFNDACNVVNRQLTDHHMSWSKFRIGLNFLDVKATYFVLECRWSDKPGDQTTYQRGTLNPLYHLPRHVNQLRKAQ